MKVRQSKLMFVLLLQLLLSNTSTAAATNEGLVPLADIADMKRKGRLSRNCFSALAESDANRNGRLSKPEYVDFLKMTTPEGLRPLQVETYSRLPLLLQSTFFALSCICPEETSCCLAADPYLPIYTNDGWEPEQEYMESLCRVTQSAVEQIIQQEEFPTASPTIDTDSPTISPTRLIVTDRPTVGRVPTPAPPTISPSSSPTTPAPVVLVSDAPTSVPTRSPTSSPSAVPTTTPPVIFDSDAPTPFPTTSPTISPSAVPTTTAPTRDPTMTPSESPTTSFPSARPTRKDSSTPTVAPTARDSDLPTPSPTLLPTIMYSDLPTTAPSALPTVMDSELPTATLSLTPTVMDSSVPTASPSTRPTRKDSSTPTATPSLTPTVMESDAPTATPSVGNSGRPTMAPSINPSSTPSIADSNNPTTLQSVLPSALPTIAGSNFPSVSPSLAPSATPTTIAPSSLPTNAQSGVPTTTPSSVPSFFPSNLPSSEPSMAPSILRSDFPSTSPTTAVPSHSPSVGPTNLPSLPPSLSPTITPVPTPFPSVSAAPSISPAPTISPLTTIRTSYAIVVTPKNLTQDTSVYIFDLIGAMDIVAAETAAEVEDLPVVGSNSSNLRRRNRRRLLKHQRRRLEVRVQLPTGIERIESIAPTGSSDCPNDLDEENSVCQIVDAEVRLGVTNEHDNQETIDLFRERLEANIQQGRLIEALSLVEPNSAVTIATGGEFSGGGDGDRSIGVKPESLGLGTGSIIGIALAAIVICVGSVFLQRQAVRQQEDRRALYAAMIEPVEDGDLGEIASESDSSEKGYAMPFLQFQQEGGEGESKVTQQRSAPEATATTPTGTSHTKKDGTGDGGGEDSDNVSYENSSGWSDNFSESMGSVDTGSIDNSPEKKGADISGDVPVSERLDEMEAAMKAGDWSSVGASAALLAASQDDRGGAGVSLLKGGMDETKMDQETAEQFEQMINAGDWEGVIQAAAKLEANKSLDVSAEDYDDEGASNGGGTTNSGDDSGPYPGDHRSLSPGADDGPSEETRAEVIDLVNKVVPEESDNVDEMLAQFKGREHELLETLRTMQERDIALKAKRVAEEQTKLDLTANKNDEKMQRKIATIDAAMTAELGIDDFGNEDLIHDDDDDSASL